MPHYRMSYATATVTLTGALTSGLDNGKESFSVAAEVPGDPAVRIQLWVPASASALKQLQETKPGDRLIASGPLSLIEDGNLPRITALVVCPASPDQYLSEAVIVGRIGSDAKVAESGKSAKRSVAVNRYRRNPETDETIEETDWFAVRAFGFNMQKLERLAKGSLVQVAGTLSQMTSSKGEAYPELKARSITTHKGRKGGQGDPSKGTKASGYDSEAFMGDAADISLDWD
jgi:single-stranded DNA-binding protein